MNPTKLLPAKLPKMLGEVNHMNQILKVFSFAAVLVATMTSALLFITATRPPLILTLNTAGTALERAELPKAEDQVRAAIERYLALRYRWEPGNVKEKLKHAEAFVLPVSLKAYQAAVANISKFSTEKAVSQRIYPDRIEVSVEKKTVLISGDRVTAIQGLKAAGNLRLELSFESGPRTKENPWGLYVIKEREEN